MTNIIGKFIEWLLPERSGRIALIDQLVEENKRLSEKIDKIEEKYEKRISALETKSEEKITELAKHACFRDCNHRLTINRVLQSKTDCTANNKDCTNA